MFSQAAHNSRYQPIEPDQSGTQTAMLVAEIIRDLRPDNVDMLEAFHRIQREFGYVPRGAVPVIAGHFQTTPAIVFGTIDFYSEVHTTPQAEKVLEWCSGPACLLKNSIGIRRAIEATFGCGMNQVTPDGKLGLRLVQCDGTCHLAPLLRFEGKYLGPLTTSDAIELARGIAGIEPPSTTGNGAEATESTGAEAAQ